MNWIVQKLWLIPALPLLAAGLGALLKQRQRRLAAGLAIGAMVLALALSCLALANTFQHPGHGSPVRQGVNFFWFQFGDPRASGTALWLGWVLDPLAAVMLVMVSFVGLLIFIYSLGYMARDANFTRFFCFLSLFAAAMLGLVIANSLLLLFICWEIVGLTSYLLIGFLYHQPSAAAAAKKAFITTRIGDLALLLGMVWLYSRTGTLLFYDGGNGCLEAPMLAKAFPMLDSGPLSLLGIALLIFVGAMGKSGQFPLHVWLPDAMEGPTPVSALIHAATMVAAGVFLVARVFVLMKPDWAALAGPRTLVSLPPPDATVVITWVGAITAVFAATIAVAQTDLKRILAYSTVSQLGFMMMGLGVGGVAVGMFHLITHAFFKALLFLGAGSVIHACGDEQDIRRLGGLRKFMPVTFAAYAVGMLALSGFPLLFSGFWSKDEILRCAHLWSVSRWPFYLGLFGALLTAFYMTRQVCYVFLGSSRSSRREGASISRAPILSNSEHSHVRCHEAQESPPVITIPLLVLAAFSILLGFIGTPAWPWFQGFLNGQPVTVDPAKLFEPEGLWLIVLSTLIVFSGIGLGWWLYGRKPVTRANEPDVLEQIRPDIFALLREKYFVDEIYDATVIRFNAWCAKSCAWLDYWLWNGAVQFVSYAVVALAWLNHLFDEHVVNLGFEKSCRGLTEGGTLMARLQNGRVQNYLRVIGLALAVLVLLLVWGCRAS
jgi:NADH-quinone oxidoreductase subunit L